MKTYLQLLDVNRSDILYIFKIVENQKYIQIFYYKITKSTSCHSNVEGTGRRARGRKQLPVDLKEKEKVLEIQRGSASLQVVLALSLKEATCLS